MVRMAGKPYEAQVEVTDVFKIRWGGRLQRRV